MINIQLNLPNVLLCKTNFVCYRILCYTDTLFTLFFISYSAALLIHHCYHCCSQLCIYISVRWYFYCQVNYINVCRSVSRHVQNFFLEKRDFFADTAQYSMQDTPRRRLYLSTAVDSEFNFLDRRGRGRWDGETRRDGTGEEIRERGKICRHTEGLARRPKRITEFVFSWTITGVVPSSLSLSLTLLPCVFLSFGPLPSSPPPVALPSRLFQFLSPERNAMATLRGTKFRRKFLRKSHCHLSRSLIRRTYRSREKCLRPRDDALLLARDTAGECFYYRGST